MPSTKKKDAGKPFVVRERIASGAVKPPRMKPAPMPVDTTGMDPEMKATMKQEMNRKDMMNKMFAPLARLVQRSKNPK